MTPTETRIAYLADEATDRATIYWIAAHYSTDGLVLDMPSTYHEVDGGLPFLLAAFRDRVELGATRIEVTKIQQRRQAEKASV